MVAAGYQHSIFQQGNKLWVMGNNQFGQLGDGTTTNHYIPEAIYSANGFSGITAVSAGAYHSLYAVNTAIPSISRYSYGLWAMGQNEYGQLGDGTTSNQDSPENILIVDEGGEISSVAAGFDHSLYVLPNGSLWVMGDNSYGQLGTGNSLSYYAPVMVVSSGVVAVAAGSGDSFFIKSDGSLWAMGLNYHGELGDGTLTNKSSPEQVLTGVTAVAAGLAQTLCIRSDGTLWGAGDNLYNELGDGTNSQYNAWFPIGPSNVVAIAAGEDHSLFIKSDGSLWGMGYNYAGQLGSNHYSLSNVPVEMIVPPPSPTISSISVAGTNIVVTWPTNQGGFYLESTTNLTLPAAWGAVSPGAVIVNGQYTVTNPISASHQFYRLSE